MKDFTPCFAPPAVVVIPIAGAPPPRAGPPCDGDNPHIDAVANARAPALYIHGVAKDASHARGLEPVELRSVQAGRPAGRPPGRPAGRPAGKPGGKQAGRCERLVNSTCRCQRLGIAANRSSIHAGAKDRPNLTPKFLVFGNFKPII